MYVYKLEFKWKNLSLPRMLTPKVKARDKFFHLNSCHVTFFTACNSALGMESGKINNSQITASSVWSEASQMQPWAARLNNPNGFWHAKQARVGEWLQIDFKQKTVVTKIATKGRPTNSQWVTSYKISFSQEAVLWDFYKEKGEEKVGRFTVHLGIGQTLGRFRGFNYFFFIAIVFFFTTEQENCILGSYRAVIARNYFTCMEYF